MKTSPIKAVIRLMLNTRRQYAIDITFVITLTCFHNSWNHRFHNVQAWQPLKMERNIRKQKMAALIRQANSWHQMKETKQLKPPENPKRLPTCKHKVENTHTHTQKKPTTKPQQSNRLLSATKEWTTTVIRAQSKNNCANNKQMESQTNHNKI